jgi:hypothetical protein
LCTVSQKRTNILMIMEKSDMDDAINHPAHYTQFGNLECIQVTERFNFCRGNAIKYIWRAGGKDATKEIEDLKKAVWYINREIERLEKQK